MPQHRNGAVGRAYHLAVVERLEKRIKELESRQVEFMDAEGEAVRIRIDSPHATTRNLVAAAMRDAGFSVTVDGLQAVMGGFSVAAKTERTLGHTRVRVVIETNTDARSKEKFAKEAK